MPRIDAMWVKYWDFDFFSSPISVNRQKGENGFPQALADAEALDGALWPIVKARTDDMLSEKAWRTPGVASIDHQPRQWKKPTDAALTL